MERLSVNQRQIGVVPQPSGNALARVWAPKARQLSIRLHSRKQIIPLRPVDAGYWEATLAEVKAGERYSWIFDELPDRPDPASLSQPEGVHGPSEVLDLAGFEWTDTQWQNPPLESYILYELHTGAFSPEGTFAGIESRLEYLIELGITAIEIMPVSQFPGSRNWGYDGVCPFAVQDSYGGAIGLQRLVNACHEKGLAVVLDVVYNHLGPEGNYLLDFGPYFTAKHQTPWGDAVNFDDEGREGVRSFFIENALMWLRDFHIDALRLDAVHAIRDQSPLHILAEIRQYIDQLQAATGRKHHLIVETDLDDPRYLYAAGDGGFGMDARWLDAFHHSLRVTAGQERTGYYAGFEGIRNLAQLYQGHGPATGYQEKNDQAWKEPGRSFIVFSQNHDQIGNRMLGERTSQLLPFELQKVLAAAVLISPYLPLLFMGEEWGEPNPFLYFVSHSDPELAAAVREGRKAEFAAFHATGTAPDPLDPASLDASRLQWDLRNQEPHSSLLRFYQRLIALRKSEPPLRNLDPASLKVSVSETQQTLVLNRRFEDQHILCLMNFSDQPQPMTLLAQAPVWHLRLDSAAPEWGGPFASPSRMDGGASLMLPPTSFLLYANHHD